MSSLFYSLSPALLAAGTALMIIGSLAACILTMSQWFIHRRTLATGFLLSVTVLMSFYTWGFAVTIINSQAGIFVLNDHYFGWFVLICLGLGLALLKTSYRFAVAPLLVFLTALLPPIMNLGGKWVLLAAGTFSTTWLGVQVWRQWQLLQHDLSPFSIKEALDRPEHGVLFSDSRGHNKLVNSSMERLLASLNLTSLTRYDTLASQLRQLATDKIIPAYTATEGAEGGGAADNTTANFRINAPEGRTWMLNRTQLADKRHFWTQLIALDVSKHMSLSQELSDEIDSFQERQKQLAHETARLDEALTKRLVLRTRSSIHDTISQRISFVHRFLEDGVSDDQRLAQLRALLAKLPTDLSHDRAIIPATVWLATLQDLASAAQLDLHISGELPTEEDRALLFVQVLREGITNVLIHTTSTEMTASMWEDAHSYWLEVSNPGAVTTTPAYGTGLSGLEARLESAGGSLTILTTPSFTLRACLPRSR
ncbi:ATP-binding protein [Actinotignum urinale]|uniref:sensor histidine kinase n=1 Tax=Actinotignum urinale TaxID=190146 RepID=UPI002A8253A6|nr:ATP-binding protein [Actinotignum urinale]MDY5152332.1 ATP-binding protein [Actinotignum urinale]